MAQKFSGLTYIWGVWTRGYVNILHMNPQIKKEIKHKPHHAVPLQLAVFAGPHRTKEISQTSCLSSLPS